MKKETRCPYCNQINDCDDEERFAEGPREYHAECWYKMLEDEQEEAWNHAREET